VYSNFVSKVDTDVFGGSEHEYVSNVAEYAHQKQFERIDCSCGASIPSSQGEQRDVFHCHPSFHSYPYLRHPWYIGAMVNLRVSGDDVEDATYLPVAAHILLFACLSDNEDSIQPPVIVAVIHSLSSAYDPKPDSLLFLPREINLMRLGLRSSKLVQLKKLLLSFLALKIRKMSSHTHTMLLRTSWFSPQGTNGLIFGRKCSDPTCIPNVYLIFNLTNPLSWQSSRIEVILGPLVSVMCVESITYGSHVFFIAHHFSHEFIQHIGRWKRLFLVRLFSTHNNGNEKVLLH
jgi:hypothetical protein